MGNRESGRSGNDASNLLCDCIFGLSQIVMVIMRFKLESDWGTLFHVVEVVKVPSTLSVPRGTYLGPLFLVRLLMTVVINCSSKFRKKSCIFSIKTQEI